MYEIKFTWSTFHFCTGYHRKIPYPTLENYREIDISICSSQVTPRQYAHLWDTQLLKSRTGCLGCKINSEKSRIWKIFLKMSELKVTYVSGGTIRIYSGKLSDRLSSNNLQVVWWIVSLAPHGVRDLPPVPARLVNHINDLAPVEWHLAITVRS